MRERDYEKIVTHGENGEYGHPRHRACHDVLAHLRPEKLWCFDRGKKLDTKMIKEKSELLQVYKSQVGVLDWFNWEHETISKFR